MTPTPTEPWWFAPAVVAALVAAIVGIVTLIVNGRGARNDRQRQLFAGAFGDVAAYCEFPYIVRRRRHDAPEEERVRISTELSEIQRRLNHNAAVLRVEAPRVAEAYGALIDASRAIAGAAIHDGWNLEPATSDRGIHVGDVDLAALRSHEDRYLVAAADHLALTPSWIRASSRWLATKATIAWRARRRDRTGADLAADEAEPLAEAA